MTTPDTGRRKAEEVAKKVYASWTNIDTPDNKLYGRIVGDITQALTAFAAEARAEGYDAAVHDLESQWTSQGFNQGYAQAKEDAAKIAHDYYDWQDPSDIQGCAIQIFDKIRTLAPKGEK